MRVVPASWLSTADLSEPPTQYRSAKLNFPKRIIPKLGSNDSRIQDVKIVKSLESFKVIFLPFGSLIGFISIFICFMARLSGRRARSDFFEEG